jgi:hypothetical protein
LQGFTSSSRIADQPPCDKTQRVGHFRMRLSALRAGVCQNQNATLEEERGPKTTGIYAYAQEQVNFP